MQISLNTLNFIIFIFSFFLVEYLWLKENIAFKALFSSFVCLVIVWGRDHLYSYLTLTFLILVLIYETLKRKGK